MQTHHEGGVVVTECINAAELILLVAVEVWRGWIGRGASDINNGAVGH